MGFDERVKEQRNKSLLQDVERYLKVLERDGYVMISVGGTGIDYTEQELLRIISLVIKDGKYSATKRNGLNTWDVQNNPNYETNKSVIDTNKSLRQTNRLQKWSLIVTGVAIVVSCFFQGFSLEAQKKQIQLEKDKQKSDSLKEVYLMERIHSIQKQLDSMQKQKNH